MTPDPLAAQAFDAAWTHYTELWKDSAPDLRDQFKAFWLSAWSQATEEARRKMGCGHPQACVWTGDEGTMHCEACEQQAQAVAGERERCAAIGSGPDGKKRRRGST